MSRRSRIITVGGWNWKCNRQHCNSYRDRASLQLVHYRCSDRILPQRTLSSGKPELGPRPDRIAALVTAALFFVTLLLHELAHSLVLDRHFCSVVATT
jgi:hypothetical protein